MPGAGPPSRCGTNRTLVLNATYEPIGVVSGLRAVVLVLADKVDVLAHSKDAVRSEHRSVSIPSVVRLRYFVRVPYRRETPVSRRAVFGRDRNRCQYCDEAAENIDHVIPRSRGGRHIWTNVVACCRRCNSKKSDFYLHQTSLRLRSSPAAPPDLAWIRLAAGSVPTEWDEYLDRLAA